VAFIQRLCWSSMVSARERACEPQSHPIADNNACGSTEDFEASDEETGCHSDDDNFLDVAESSDTEVGFWRNKHASCVLSATAVGDKICPDVHALARSGLQKACVIDSCRCSLITLKFVAGPAGHLRQTLQPGRLPCA
jgi:hypothetical protein